MSTPSHHDRVQLDRLVFFSDAIFAIAITLLIIEVRVPEFHREVTELELANALLALIPQYIGFLISFFVIGRFWIGHHRAFGFLTKANDRIVWRNLLFLLSIAFMPFPTAVISHYASTRVGVGFYAVWLIFAGLMNLFVMRTLTISDLLEPVVDAPERARWVRRAWAPVLVGTLAFAAAMITPLAAFVPLLASPFIVRWFGRAAKVKPVLPSA